MLKSTLAALLLVGLLTPAAGDAPQTEVASPEEVRALALVEHHLARERTRRLEPELRDELARTLVRECAAHDLEPALVLAVIEVESRFDTRAVSKADAHGLMQIQPRTGLAWARRLGIPWRGVDTLYDPIDNVRIGIAYLARLRDRFGSLPTALSAYNQGPTRVSRRLGAGQGVPAGYARRVMQAWAGHLSVTGS
jgi:soluble lytic murein transglycosylase-like protein